MDMIAEGLLFPEGPIAMADGSVILVELARQTLSRVQPNGQVDVIAHCGGGPNGAAIGPDGRVYVCNNGGFDDVSDKGGFFAKFGMPREYVGGSIQAVDLGTGEVEVLYTECNGHPLRGPNDLVFDANGGFWFTDLGKSGPRHHDHGGIYYAQPDGSSIREVIYPLRTPNGIGLSPDGTVLYAAETDTCRVYQWEVLGPGSVGKQTFLYGLGSGQRFDSLAVDSEGHICVATIGRGGGVSDISPSGDAEFVPTNDAVTTNLCFGGPDLQTAYITRSMSGTLVSTTWPRAGQPLAFTG